MVAGRDTQLAIELYACALKAKLNPTLQDEVFSPEDQERIIQAAKEKLHDMALLEKAGVRPSSNAG